MARRKSTKRVAIVISDPGDAEIRIARGVVNYYLEIDHWEFAGGELRPYNEFRRVHLDAVDGVVGSFFERTWMDDLARAGVAGVNTSGAVKDSPLPYVGPDNQAIGQAAGLHLLERGFVHLAFVPPRHGRPWFSETRLAGFRKVVEQDAGRACHVFDHSTGDGATYPKHFAKWLMRLPKPVGVLAAVDAQAFMVVQVARELGLRVPNDVAVVGVDNHEWAATTSRVPLSSVDPDWEQIGYRAARALDGMMHGTPPPPAQWIPPLGVVTRASTEIMLQDDPLVSEALRFISDHHGELIGVEDVVEAVGVSRTTLEMRLKAATGLSPHAAISRARVEHAKTMLLTTRVSMDDISRVCGFRRQQRFNRVFRRLTGMTPGEFRDQRGR